MRYEKEDCARDRERRVISEETSIAALQAAYLSVRSTACLSAKRNVNDQPSPSSRRRFALLAGLGAADDLSGRRDENWLTGTGAAFPGIQSERRRADTVALACACRILAEDFVADFAADLVGPVSVFFAADRVGAIVFF